MIKEIQDKEYLKLIGIYPISHFMGGVGGTDNSKEILLVRDKIYLVEVGDNIDELRAEQEKEAKEFVKKYEEEV